MRSFLVVVLVAAGVPGAAWAAGDEDDPAFARKAAVSAAEADEPFPDPVPYVEEDPGLGGAAAPDAALRAKAPPRRPPPGGPTGIGLRVGYRTLALPEAAGRPAGGTQPFTDSRFHGLSLDVYPISSWVRLGLATYLAREGQDDDWLAMEGIVLGVQQPGRRFTAYIEGGVYAGLARRTFWLAEPVPDAQARQDDLTLLWAFGLEAGVDGHLSRSVIATFAVGLQRTSYFFTDGDLADRLKTYTDGALTLKVGLGY